MSYKIFMPGDILLPEKADMERWSTVACDQFSSQPDYWDEAEKLVGGAPSTLRLMLPEAYLGVRDTALETEKISRCMRDYISSGVFSELKNSYIYIERTLPSGRVRRGLMGVIDLEAYDYGAASQSPVRATEGTVESRLPPRVRVRERALLEMPHIMVFIDDEERGVIEPLGGLVKDSDKLYDFELMLGGGHIKGWRICGDMAASADSKLSALSSTGRLMKKYGAAPAPAVFAVGDGNHSLATAKLFWERVKPALSDKERESHPARYSLVELVNIHDHAIEFEAIHRVIFDTNAEEFLSEAQKFWSGKNGPGSGEHKLCCMSGTSSAEINVRGMTIGGLIGEAERFCSEYIGRHGGRLDYIHGDETARGMALRDGCAAVLLPEMDKNELFESIIKSGPLPRKSFSMGSARDKRYYLECRKIVK